MRHRVVLLRRLRPMTAVVPSQLAAAEGHGVGPSCGGRMGYLLRHVLAVALLPATVVVVVPMWIGRRFGVQPDWPSTSVELMLATGGVLVIVVGMALFGASLRHFFVHGRGTLAPWDPPRRLVLRGPYRYVRNPMIAGVIFTLFGLALAIRSVPHALWAGVFLIVNAIYIPLLEEPLLERRFGADYTRYTRHVPRFIPRLRPWSGEDQGPLGRAV